MAAWMKVTMDERMSGRERLRLLRKRSVCRVWREVAAMGDGARLPV
jgi:hypothetical protein